MRLVDLSPAWLNEEKTMFVFKCPSHPDKDDWLSCKNIVMGLQDQFDLFEKFFGEDWNLKVAPCRAEYAWSFSSDADFNTLTVLPSIDASRSGSGHWHGFIRNGEIT